MQLLFEVVSAKKNNEEQAPATQQPMRQGQVIRRNPSTDQKKIRREMARKAGVTSLLEDEGLSYEEIEDAMWDDRNDRERQRAKDDREGPQYDQRVHGSRKMAQVAGAGFPNNMDRQYIMDEAEGEGCPECGGPAEHLGDLGSEASFRCQNCGWTWQETFSNTQGESPDPYWFESSLKTAAAPNLSDPRNDGMCEQCGVSQATVYAMGSGSGDWGGRYCVPCADALRFPIREQLKTASSDEFAAWNSTDGWASTYIHMETGERRIVPGKHDHYQYERDNPGWEFASTVHNPGRYSSLKTAKTAGMYSNSGSWSFAMCIASMREIAIEAPQANSEASRRYPNGMYDQTYAQGYADMVAKLVGELEQAYRSNPVEALAFAQERLVAIDGIQGDGDYVWATLACRRIVDPLIVSRPEWLKHSSKAAKMANADCSIPGEAMPEEEEMPQVEAHIGAITDINDLRPLHSRMAAAYISQNHRGTP